MARNALGRGLSGLIPQGDKKKTKTAHKVHLPSPADAAGLSEIPVSKIKASKYQPRENFDDAKLTELADSIRELGLVQPVVVRKLKKDSYELIAGERRLRAVTILGWEKVPVCFSDAADADLREMALVENLQREDLNPIEIANSLDTLHRENGLTDEQIAGRIGKSRAWVTNAKRLLKLPGEVRDMVASEELSGGHGRTLLGLSDPLSQIDLAKKIIRDKLPVQEVERVVKRMTSTRKPGAKPSTPRKADKHVADLEERLSAHFGLKVNINDKDGKGKIEIEYYSHDDIASIMEKIGLDAI